MFAYMRFGKMMCDNLQFFNVMWHTQFVVARLVLEASRKRHGLITLVIASHSSSSFLFYSIGFSY